MASNHILKTGRLRLSQNAMLIELQKAKISPKEWVCIYCFKIARLVSYLKCTRHHIKSLVKDGGFQRTLRKRRVCNVAQVIPTTELSYVHTVSQITVLLLAQKEADLEVVTVLAMKQNQDSNLDRTVIAENRLSK